MDRRAFLQAAAGLPFAGIALPRAGQAAAAAIDQRVLLLIELNGGNDGLNTVVPYADPAYRRARPGLALDRERLLPLDERHALAADLQDMMPAWTAGDLAIALGVGYDRPNRSHFRSIEIWNSASDADETLQEGWISRVLGEYPASRSAAGLDGVVLGGSMGPLSGPALSAVVLRDPERFSRLAGGEPRTAAAPTNAGLAHILSVRAELHQAAALIDARLNAVPEIPTDFLRTPLGRQFAVAARLITAGLPIRVIKLSHSGYDTHSGQSGRQPRLLRELAGGIAAFRRVMLQTGFWRDVLVMTYAEFGRRLAENASGGTDHGTAAPHFLIGGRVKGGLYGVPPSLTDLENGDLKYTIDFRRLYATVAQDWWELPPTAAALGRARPLPCLA